VTLWLILAAITLATVGLLLRPLLRGPSAPPPRAAYDLEVYRDQLAEVKREEARGLIVPAEARAAEREIARRLLAAISTEERKAGSGTAPRRAARSSAAAGTRARRWAAFAIAALVPVATFALYVVVGAPGIPDFPLAGREQAMNAAGMPDLDRAIAGLEERLKARPDDLAGWLLLARSDAALQRYAPAAEAYHRAVALSGRRPEIVSAYAEALVMREGGRVTEEARGLFAEVHAKAPEEARARFYLGLAKAQAGDGKGALGDWLTLAASAPANAPWLPALRAEIARTAEEYKLDPATLAPSAAEVAPSAAATAAGPSAADVAGAEGMSPVARAEMIRSMVERLAARLEKTPEDVEGWRSLGRSYQVLGEPAEAAGALAHAAKLAPQDPDVLADYGDALIALAKPGDQLPPEGVAVMRQVLALDGMRREALWYVGLAEAERGNKAAALALWNRLSTQLAPGTPEFEEVRRRIDGLAGGR
jgi:cytochrome c-type biogenesis protein CcmH